jgi:hypothetical protein
MPTHMQTGAILFIGVMVAVWAFESIYRLLKEMSQNTLAIRREVESMSIDLQEPFAKRSDP